MKNAIYFIIFTIILSSIVYSEENIKEYRSNTPINIDDMVVNISGRPCLSCNCNFTLYNINKSINKSLIMSSSNNGFYNVSIGILATNINDSYYPVSIVCADGANYGVSSLTGIKIKSDNNMYIAIALFMVCAVFITAYIAVALEPSDPIKIWMKWILIVISMIFLDGSMILGNIITNEIGYSNLSIFFEIMIWLVSAIIFLMISFLYLHRTFVSMYKLGDDNPKDDIKY